MSQLEEQTAYTRPDLKHIFSRQIGMKLIPEIQAAALGKITPQQALDNAEAAVNALLERNKK